MKITDVRSCSTCSWLEEDGINWEVIVRKVRDGGWAGREYWPHYEGGHYVGPSYEAESLRGMAEKLGPHFRWIGKNGAVLDWMENVRE